MLCSSSCWVNMFFFRFYILSPIASEDLGGRYTLFGRFGAVRIRRWPVFKAGFCFCFDVFFLHFVNKIHFWMGPVNVSTKKIKKKFHHFRNSTFTAHVSYCTPSATFWGNFFLSFLIPIDRPKTVRRTVNENDIFKQMFLATLSTHINTHMHTLWQHLCKASLLSNNRFANGCWVVYFARVSVGIVCSTGWTVVGERIYRKL